MYRQTNVIQAIAAQGIPVNINKAQATGNQQILVSERGVLFGYNNLVSFSRDARHRCLKTHILPGGQGRPVGRNKAV